jgi:fructokinase
MDTRPAALPRVVVFGEALTDLIRQDDATHWLARPGGAPWNVARVVARVGVPAAFAGAVSRDVFGDDLAERSAAAGLDMRFLQRVDRSPLLAVVPSVTPPRYFFVGNDSADLHFDATRLPEGWRDAAEVVHFGSISLARQPLGARLVTEAERCRAAGRHVTFDPNHRAGMGPDYRPTLERMVRLADTIKCSDEDLAGLFPGCGSGEGLDRLRAWNPAALLLQTHGARGLTLLSPAGVLHQPAYCVDVADTVGAGDACMGGWIASRLLRPDAPPSEHLAFAAATAAAACRRPGAHAPTPAEIAEVRGG